MEDIFKVIFYIIAVTLWIIYKAREQKKKGGLFPKAENEYETKPEPTLSAPEVLKKVVIERGPKPKPRVKQVQPNPRLQEPVSYEAYKPEATESIETYRSAFLEKILKEDQEKHEDNERLLAEEQTQSLFVFDAKQAILGSEILKRPTW